MKLQDELKRPHPFVSSEQEVILNLLRAADQIENRLSRLFRDHDLTLSRFNVLRSLILADRPLTCGEIGERMIQVVPAITSLVDHLEQQGLVERHRSTEDRRVVHVSVTDRGRKLADKTTKPLWELEKRLLKNLTESKLKSMIDLLETTRESITACDAAAKPTT